MKITIYISLLLFIISCSPVTVSSSYNRSNILSDYETFAWKPNLREDLTGSNSIMDERMVSRVMNEVYKEMILKGFRFVDRQPDVLVNLVVKNDSDGLKFSTEDGYSYWNGYNPDPDNYSEGTLIIELLHPDDKIVLWHGSAKGLLKKSRTQYKIQEVLRDMFDQYENQIL